MGSKKKALAIVVVLMVVCTFFAETASARFLFFGKKITPEERLQRYEEIEEQKQAAEREKREAREAARAQKEEQARLKQFNAEAKRQAREEVNQAKIERNQKVAAVNAKEKEQASAIKDEGAGIKQALNISSPLLVLQLRKRDFLRLNIKTNWLGSILNIVRTWRHLRKDNNTKKLKTQWIKSKLSRNTKGRWSR
ncbi:MAG: hypothetical protein ACYSTX_03225 [Planctomycetota bacterium]|jgi:flagellar basal body-associated protein FliL